MDAEIGLPVGQVIVVVTRDDEAYRNITAYSVTTTICCANTRNTRHGFAFGLIANGVTLTTVVVSFAYITCSECQRGDILLIRVAQAVEGILRNDGAHSVWRVAHLEGTLNHIYIARLLHVDRRIVAFFVRQTLVFCA